MTVIKPIFRRKISPLRLNQINILKSLKFPSLSYHIFHKNSADSVQPKITLIQNINEFLNQQINKIKFAYAERKKERGDRERKRKGFTFRVQTSKCASETQ